MFKRLWWLKPIKLVGATTWVSEWSFDPYSQNNGFRVKFDVKESFHRLFVLFYFINGISFDGHFIFKKYFSIGIFVAFDYVYWKLK